MEVRSPTWNSLYSSSLKNRKQTPGPVRPARPFLWSALAFETLVSFKRRIRDIASHVNSFTRPESATNLNITTMNFKCPIITRDRDLFSSTLFHQ